jgi:hypothetical protein
MKVVQKKARDEMIDEAGETEGARRATGVFPAGAPTAGAAPGAERPEVKVVAKAERRRFTAEYKWLVLYVALALIIAITFWNHWKAAHP